jgi:hypothetical protein
MSTLDRNKPTRNDRLRLIASGVQKHFPNATLTLAGQTLTTSQLADRIQQDIAASDATDKARAAWLTQVQAERSTHASLAPVLRSLRSLVIAQFGDSPDAGDVLADFGYSPRKVPERTAAAKAQSADKGRATRAARHTMGSQQKKKVKGTVTATPPPGVDGPAPAPAPSPVPTISAPAPKTAG